MIQVLCYTGRGFDTCWRPINVAAHYAVCLSGPGIDAQYTPIRFFTGDFA